MDKTENTGSERSILKRNAAIILAAGQGRRMNTDTAKQYLMLDGKPVLYYALRAFEQSRVDDVVLVTGEKEIAFCQKEIVEKYGFSKVRCIVSGGKQRYHSVARGLETLAADGGKQPDGVKTPWKEPGIVMIHDGARCFVQPELINSLLEETGKYPACVTGTPLKDTVKVVDGEQYCVDTPNRSTLWTVQTPQSFAFRLVLEAYRELMEREEELLKQGVLITDDAMVVELFGDRKVRLVMGDYLNSKLTTPEDLLLAHRILEIFDTKYSKK